MKTKPTNITLAAPCTKVGLYGEARLPRERLEPQREAIEGMIRMLRRTAARLNEASDRLTEDNLQTIADAVEMAARAVVNLENLGCSGYTPYEVKAIEWRYAP